jgi:hypothetical protein
MKPDTRSGVLKSAFCLILLLLSVTPCFAQDMALSVTAQQGFQGQALAPSYWLVVKLDSKFYDPEKHLGYTQVRSALKRAVNSNGLWNCADKKNYTVTIGKKTVDIVRVAVNGNLSQDVDCKTAFGGDNTSSLDLLISENRIVNIYGTATVSINGITYTPDPAKPPIDLKLKGKAAKAIDWKAKLLTVSAQAITNENLNNSTVDKTGVFQFPLSAMLPVVSNSRGGLFVDSKDLFSTNERDTKSAFEGGIGYQVGLSTHWYAPLKFEQQIQGNQVVTNLSSVSMMQVTTCLPFVLSTKSETWRVIDAPIPASFTLGLPYTHRVNQLASTKSKLLPVDDFAVNPALALSSGRLFYWKCDPSAGAGKSPGFCLNWDGNVGLWYLSLETTSKGSQRAEGYWDASVLVPMTDFVGIPYTTLDSKTQISQMRLRIKYEDSVNQANNYARTKKWSFGLELAVQ